MEEHRPLTAEERRKQISEEKERIRKRFRGVDQSLLDCIPAAERASLFDDASEKRVCAYCRVSTDDVNQTSSIELQQHIYEQMIAEHPGWQLIKIYVDEGISGTSTAHREAFQEMLRDCEAGLIDVIMAKSVSRFARNTVDCISIIRKLKFAKHPVGVYFETERFYTLDANSELMLNMMAMLAQSESQTKSDVMNGSIEHRFRMGIFLTPPLLGYDKDGDGNLIVNEEEANTVRLMYYMTLAGSPTSAIVDTLLSLGRKTKLSNTKWTASGITAMMRNERYCGEVLARKTFTPNFLDHKSKKNRRNRNQYRMSDHHEPIVTKEQWRAVQKILDSRRYGLKGGYVPLRVIEGGALQGFVSLHRQWAGAAPDDYYTASRTAYGKDLPDYLRWVDDEPAEEQEAGDAEQDAEEEISEPTPPKGGFQVVSMSLFSRADEPAMIITGHAFRFNVNCIKRMGGTTHVELLMNPLEHLLAIRPCAPDHPNEALRRRIQNERRRSRAGGHYHIRFALSGLCRKNSYPEDNHSTPAIAGFFVETLGIIKSLSYNGIAGNSLTTIIRGDANEKYQCRIIDSPSAGAASRSRRPSETTEGLQVLWFWRDYKVFQYTGKHSLLRSLHGRFHDAFPRSL